jgi:hypothetical protein
VEVFPWRLFSHSVWLTCEEKNNKWIATPEETAEVGIFPLQLLALGARREKVRSAPDLAVETTITATGTKNADI